MKTIFIYDQCGQGQVSFFTIEGDYSHLDRVIVNDCENEAFAEELMSLLVDEHYVYKVDMLKAFPRMEEGDVVIVVGFSS